MAILETGEPPIGGQNAPKTDLAASLPSGTAISSLEWKSVFSNFADILVGNPIALICVNRTSQQNDNSDAAYNTVER